MIVRPQHHHRRRQTIWMFLGRPTVDKRCIVDYNHVAYVSINDLKEEKVDSYSRKKTG